MSTLVVVGAQWGDEGKGKVVDALATSADLVARYSGGNNAGHTLVVEGRKIVTHLVPSGCAYPGTACVLGSGMVIDPDVFIQEVNALRDQGLVSQGELAVSWDAHLIMPHHRLLDGLREDAAQASGNKIGTTRRGIGPAYEAKARRQGLRVRDLFDLTRFEKVLNAQLSSVSIELQALGHSDPFDKAELLDKAKRWAEFLGPMACDASEKIVLAARSGKKVLLEGAQGALLDVDHGTYPYVTSTSTIAGGACTGLGVGPTLIDEVWGISKAYTTRVGEGPFPTRLNDAQGEAIRQAGAEFGATTGRPRCCGWLDLPALNYAARINGLTALCLTKLDVMAALPAVRLCVGYEDGLTPGRDGFDQARPIYEDVPNWGDESWVHALRSASSLEDFPAPVRAYLDRIVEATQLPLALVSVGPDRSETLFLREAFQSRGA